VQYGDFKIRKIISDLEFTHKSIDGDFEFYTNNKGFRNKKDITYDKVPEVIRVFCVGDSHTQGMEVNQHETFSAVCEKTLNDNGIPAEVFNAGVSGFSTAEALILVENELIKYNPEAIVLGFFENDFIDNIKCGIFGLDETGLTQLKSEHLPGVDMQNIIYRYKLFHFLGENSYLYAFTFNSIWDFYKNQLEQSNTQTIVTEYAVKTEKIDKYQMQLATKLLERLNQVCEENEIKFIVVDIPNIHMQSSIPREMLPVFKSNSDTLYYYEDLRHEYMQMDLIHVPHGNRHISAEAHNLIGKKIADYIAGENKQIN
jgi:hypothetical protein